MQFFEKKSASFFNYSWNKSEICFYYIVVGQIEWMREQVQEFGVVQQ